MLRSISNLLTIPASGLISPKANNGLLLWTASDDDADDDEDEC